MKASVVMKVTRLVEIEITPEEFAVLAAGNLISEEDEYLRAFQKVRDAVSARAEYAARNFLETRQKLHVSFKGRTLIEETL